MVAVVLSTQAQGPPRVSDLLLAGENWQLVGEGYKFTEGPATDGEGIVYFTDIPNNRIHRIEKDGKVSVFAQNTGGANGLMFGGDGLLYACQNGKKRIVAYDKDANEKIIAEDIESNDLVVSHAGDIYVTDPTNKQVWHINTKREKKVVDKGLVFLMVFALLLTKDCFWWLIADPNMCILIISSRTVRCRRSRRFFN